RAADTDATWEVEEDRGIETLRPQVHGYYAAEPGERWNAAAYNWSWSANAAGGKEWKEAVALGRGALRGETDAPNNWQLVADPLPAMEMKEVPAGKVARVSGIESPAGFPQKSFAVPAHTKAT